MFDRIDKDHRTYYPSTEKYVHIFEKRAPSDESIKLSEEMKDKILSGIMYREKPNSNIFDYRFYLVKEGGYYFKAKMVALINGKKYEVTENIYNLTPQEKESYFDENGNVCYKNKYGYEEIGFLRKEMLTRLLVQSMIEQNPKEFNKLNERFSNTLGDNWTFNERGGR